MARTAFLLSLVVVVVLLPTLTAARELASLYHPPPTVLTYHGGPVLDGDIPITLLWYGNFTRLQRGIVHDLLLSLTPTGAASSPQPAPAVGEWWRAVDRCLQKADLPSRPLRRTRVLLADQITDPDCSLGRVLTRTDVSDLAAAPKPGGITVVLTSDDVAVEGFCSSNCGFHSSRARPRSAFLWVGNSAAQCPGQCAWPFHEPIYGPPAVGALSPPNGDVGVDGMVVNLAVLLAGAVTNPYGGGFYDGATPEAAVEIGEVCPGVFGRGAYPGYPGDVLVDGRSGGSYNVVGVTGRRFLLPALFDSWASRCVPLV